jgi:hypothetical protein
MNEREAVESIDRAPMAPHARAIGFRWAQDGMHRPTPHPETSTASRPGLPAELCPEQQHAKNPQACNAS